jgi:hypothetical protein
MAKSIIRMDHPFTDLVSVKYHDGDAYAAIQNGRVLKLDGLISGEREVFKGIAPTAITDDIVIVAGVELNSDESSRTKARLDAFENAADVPFRAINPKNSVGKIFSVSDDALVKLSTASVKGNYVIIKANTTTLEEKASLGGTESFVGLIIDKETVAGTVMAAIKIIKA